MFVLLGIMLTLDASRRIVRDGDVAVHRLRGQHRSSSRCWCLAAAGLSSTVSRVAERVDARRALPTLRVGRAGDRPRARRVPARAAATSAITGLHFSFGFSAPSKVKGLRRPAAVPDLVARRVHHRGDLAAVRAQQRSSQALGVRGRRRCHLRRARTRQSRSGSRCGCCAVHAGGLTDRAALPDVRDEAHGNGERRIPPGRATHAGALGEARAAVDPQS